jgi:DNA uptake protein ComE-like DNA-binding protein
MNFGVTRQMQAEAIAERVDAEHNTIESLSYLLACVVALAFAISFSFAVLEGADEATAVRLQRWINPNDAPTASLVRLPQIGVTRAEKIIAYRQANAGDEPAFTCPDDLKNVKGIGPVIVRQLADYLRFE